ncbi:hypothetical protein FBZ93_13010 [Bradyrhizobium macuxiense]|uniref:Tc1-like transposase DDE domain-containing protein n=1 Tax=Bradyrhizobium macuxiense TaxID=1755647 RepID=A0A560KS87_9BRAD|nr:hypothetical protein FBZ93_13010 [Bradyrhizobium macuxiense]
MWLASTLPAQRAVVLCGREVPNPGARPQPADVAHAPRSARTAQPRLHPPRHDLALRGARHCDGQGHRQMLFPSPCCRARQVPRRDRGRRFARSRCPSHHGQNATHKASLIRNWLVKRPCWRVHLTRSSSSWFNQVERFFALITDEKIPARHLFQRPGSADIMDFISHHNADPKPFKWTKSADDILASIERFGRYNTQAQAS